MLDQKLEYIHQNPVTESIVYESKDYVYSSAASYLGVFDDKLKLKVLV